MIGPYYYVHKVEGKYVITLGTEETPPTALPNDKRCDWLVEAMTRASKNREGYVVKMSVEVDAAWKGMER
jgi:hypothetical protein